MKKKGQLISSKMIKLVALGYPLEQGGKFPLLKTPRLEYKTQKNKDGTGMELPP